MAEELWREMLRVSDYLLLTMQSEMFLVIYVVLGLSILFFLLQPFVKFVMTLEWSVFLTYIITIMMMFLLVVTFINVEDWRYVLYAILIFSIIISLRRGFSLKKNR